MIASGVGNKAIAPSRERREGTLVSVNKTNIAQKSFSLSAALFLFKDNANSVGHEITLSHKVCIELHVGRS